MKWSATPDLSSKRRLVLTALAVTVVVCVVISLRQGDITRTLGDTDDAMRLVLVRSLLHGQGWWDQLVSRLQPPQGVYMHWSRLLDGALAACIWLAERFVSPAAAEYAVRFVWPLLWIFPGVVGSLLIARSLGGRRAVFVGAILLLTNVVLYIQFRPGRVDHHNVQIVMATLACAFAMIPNHRVRYAVLAGAASGLGLAIGIEALAFHAIIGASFALRAAFDRREAAAARAYGLSLAAASLAFFCIQTPPWRWALPFCDALGFNLIAAILIGGLGLTLIASLSARLSTPVRLGALAVVGALAGGVYLAIEPACIHGPFASVDRRLWPIWFNTIGELQPWWKLWFMYRNSALISIAMAVMGVAAAALLVVVQWRRWTPATLLAAALVCVAAVAAANAWRMQDYAFWFGVPTLAAAITWVAERWWKALVLPTATAALVLSPVLIGEGVYQGMNLIPKKAVAGTKVAVRRTIDDRCFEQKYYARLGQLPAGVALGEIDLGPFILAHSPDSVLAAPYHRMSWGIWKAYWILGGPTAEAQERLRQLNVTYIVDCRLNPLRVKSSGFEGDLRRGALPPWIEKLTPPSDVLQIYRIKPG